MLVEVVDDDMIWVIKEATNKNDIVSMIWGVIQQIEHIISNKDRLTNCRSSRWWYDLSFVKEQWIEMILLVWSDIKLTTNWTYHIK